MGVCLGFATGWGCLAGLVCCLGEAGFVVAGAGTSVLLVTAWPLV